MTLGEYMTNQFSVAQYCEFFLRILIACLCGAAIGFERSMRFKEAGIRTHVLVCCAASVIMLVSKYGFLDLVEVNDSNLYGSRGADPSRIAAQVISGISFLGAGIIFRNGTSIRGLTTAAGIWATAGIGLAIGAGLYVIGIFSMVVVAVLQIVMHKHVLNADLLVISHLHCTVERSESFDKALEDFVRENRIQVIARKISYNENGTETHDLTMRVNPQITINDLTSFLESNEAVREIRCELGS